MLRKVSVVLILSLVFTFAISFSTEEILVSDCWEWLRGNLVDTDKVTEGWESSDSQIDESEVNYIDFILGLSNETVDEMKEVARENPIKTREELDDISGIGSTRIKQIECLGFNLK